MKGYKKLGKNIFLLTIGNFASKVLSFLLVPLYTSILTVEEYGIADILTTTVNLILPIFTMLIYEAILRFTLDKECDRNQIITIGLTINLLGFIVFLFFSPVFLSFSGIKNYYILFVLYYFSCSLYNVTSQYLKGIEKVTVFTIGGVLNTLLFISFNIIFLLFLKIGVFGYLMSFILSHLIVSIYYIVKGEIHKKIISFKNIDFKLLKRMLKYSIPMIPNSLSWWISDSSDKYLITMFKGVSATGLYSVAYKIPSLLTVLTSIFMSAWQISAVENFGTEENRLFFSDVYKKYAALSIILCTIIITFSKFVSSILFSKEFFDAWIYTPILLLAFVFNSLSAFFGTLYTTAKQTKMLFYSTVIGALVNIIMNLVLIRSLGAIGAAIATLISYLLVWLIRLINSRKIMKLSIDLKRNLLSYFLIILQILIICLEFRYDTLWSIIINCMIIFINIDFFKEIYYIFFPKIFTKNGGIKNG